MNNEEKYRVCFYIFIAILPVILKNVYTGQKAFCYNEFMNLATKLRLYIRYLLNNFKTDAISFNVKSVLDYDVDPEGWEWKETDILVNGKSLFEKLREHESYEAKRTSTDVNLAGQYVGIAPYNIKKRVGNGNNNAFSIWQCSVCHSALCSVDLECDFKITPFYVELSNFRQAAKPVPLNNTPLGHVETLDKLKWNYEGFRPFRFNRAIFMKAVRSL